MLNFARLIHPVDVDTFARRYWERQPLVVRREDARYIRDLLTLEDMERILNTTNRYAAHIQIVRNGHRRSAADSNDDHSQPTPEAWYDEFRSGSTIVVQSLHTQWPPLKALCRNLAEEFSAGFQANAYLTPARSQGFSTHYDTHDVFVVQVSGRKHWRVYEARRPLPLSGQPFRRDTDEIGRVMLELDLQPGDVLYLPRGHVHDASASETSSLHLTIGALTITWASLLLGAVESMIERDVRYRRSLPIGFARRDGNRRRLENAARALSRRLLGSFSTRAIVSDAIDRARLMVPCDLTGRLLDLDNEHRITLSTPLATRSEPIARLRRTDDTISLQFGGKRVSMPAAMRPVLQFIMQAKSFTAAQLPGALDESSRLLLVRRLLDEGYLTLQGATPIRQGRSGYDDQ